MKTRRGAWLTAATAAVLLGYQIFLVSRWVAVERRPPTWDPSVHLATSMDYAQAWRDGRWLDFIRTKTRPGHPAYPPFYDYSTMAVLSAAKPHIAVAWLNLFYWAFALAAVGWLAWLLGGPLPCAAAIAVAGLSAESAAIYRQAFPDLALAVWLPMTYAALLQSRMYENRRWSAVVGICAGLAMNSKWAAALFLIPALVPGFQGPRRRNLALAVGLCLVLMLPWYLINAPLTASRIWESVTLGHKQGHPQTWTFYNWWYYPHFAVLCYTGLGLLLMTAGAVWAALRAPAPAREARRVVGGWLVVSYLVCTLVPSKDTRYILPSMGALPALASVGLPAPALALPVALSIWNQRRLRRPDGGDWRNDDLLAEISRRGAGAPVGVCVLPNHEYLNTTSLIWQARHAGLKNISFGCQISEIPEWADFVVVKTKDQGAFLSEENLALAASTRDPKSLFSKVFAEARRWDLPDGSQAVLYAQRPDLPSPKSALRWDALKIRAATLHHVTLSPAGGEAYAVAASSVTFERLAAPVRDVLVSLKGARLYATGKRVYILGVRQVSLNRARLDLADLSRALSSRARLPIAISTRDGIFEASARYGFLTARAAFSLDVEADGVSAALRSLRVFGVSLPGAGALKFDRGLAPLPPYQPYELKIGRARVVGDELNIEPRNLAREN